MTRLFLLLALLTTPTPPAAPADLCGYSPPDGTPWYSEDGLGNPRPCPGAETPTLEPEPTPEPEPARPYRVVLSPVWR